MKATIIAIVAAATLAIALPAHAGWDVPCCPPNRACAPPPYCPIPYYAPNVVGEWYGPNYRTNPAPLPFNGMVFNPQQGQGGQGGQNGPVAFPTHPYARSPRDFFMMD